MNIQRRKTDVGAVLRSRCAVHDAVDLVLVESKGVSVDSNECKLAGCIIKVELQFVVVQAWCRGNGRGSNH